MSGDAFCEVDLNDDSTSNQLVDSLSNLPERRKQFSLSHRNTSSATSSSNQSNPLLYINTQLHETGSSPPPPPSAATTSMLDSGTAMPLPFNTPSSATRYSPSASSSPIPIAASSDSVPQSPKNLTRSAGTTDLTKQIFNFPMIRHDSIIDSLLSAIYEREGSTYGLSSSQDSDTVTTGDCNESTNMQRLSDESTANDSNVVFLRSNLANKSVQELRHLCTYIQQEINQANAILVKNLRHRDKNQSKLQRHCDIITAILQAASLKRREDTTMRFSLTPYPGEKGFQQWKDAISVAIRMPGGLLASIRQKLWISLATKYIQEIHLDWDKTCRFTFNNFSNPDDDQLGIQIVKDLHRTGCSWSSNEHDRATLKRVLLAFARYNKSIGYCQGLNILTGVILDVVDMNEEHALMVLIYLVDSVLPNFFANNLRALAIDMAVFREWLRISNGKLHLHLQRLQSSSSDVSGTIYEPPLLNVFTIQWFLTLFATCLPRNTLLRVWDALMIEGNEILFRTGLVLWSKLAISVLKAPTADQFYSVMANLSVQLLNDKIIDADTLIKEIYNFGSFPTSILSDLRQKFSFNITPFQQLSAPTTNTADDGVTKHEIVRSSSGSLKLRHNKQLKTRTTTNNDDEIPADEDIVNYMSCFAMLSASSRNNRLEHYSNESMSTNNPIALSRLTPGAYSNLPTTHKTHSIEDSLSLDISQLREQYKKLKERNKQVQVIIQAASNGQKQRSRAPSIHSLSSNSSETIRRPTITSLNCSTSRLPSSVCSISSGPLVNHLLIKPVDVKRNQLKKTVSMKSPSPMIHTDNQSPKLTSSYQTETTQEEMSQHSKEQEAEDAAELQQELDLLLTSLNLEKPKSPAAKVLDEQQTKTTNEKNQLKDVAQTLYTYEKVQATTNEKKQTPNIIDKLLTSRSVQVPKYSSFNPFPSRSFNENVAVNGYKLGLYAPDPTNR